MDSESTSLPSAVTVDSRYSARPYPHPHQDSSARIQQEQAKDQSKFPYFHDGDVLIFDGSGHSWKLHSQRLNQASPVFRRLMKDMAPIHLTKSMREQGKTVSWRLKMGEFTEDPSNLNLRTFKAIPPKGPGINLDIIAENFNGLDQEPEYVTHYSNWFASIYNVTEALNFPDRTQDHGAYYIGAIIKLLDVAMLLESVSAIRMTIEASLLRLGQPLWIHVAGKSEQWAILGATLESPVVFREAIIHLVGIISCSGRAHDILSHRTQFESDVSNYVWDLVSLKIRAHLDHKLKTERRCQEFFPPNLLHYNDSTRGVPLRSVYADDIYAWQALIIWRQWFNSACSQNLHHRAKDGGWALYNVIAQGGDAYLDEEAISGFLIPFPMSGKGKRCLLQALDLMKESMKPVVAPLLLSHSQAVSSLYRSGSLTEHFTSIEVHDKEMPWNVDLNAYNTSKA